MPGELLSNVLITQKEFSPGSLLELLIGVIHKRRLMLEVLQTDRDVSRWIEVLVSSANFNQHLLRISHVETYRTLFYHVRISFLTSTTFILYLQFTSPTL